MTPEDFHEATLAEFSRLEATLASSPLNQPVPSCPGWTLGDLGRHVTETYEWMTAALAGTAEPAARDRRLLDDSDLLDVLRATSAILFAKLVASDPDAPCWTMAPPHRVAFWVRRAAHETAVHRWDAQNAIGTADPIPPRLAADGVAEISEMFLPRQIRLGRQSPLSHSLEVRFTDVPDAGSVVISSSPTPHRCSKAVVSGPAEAILLLLWKRTGPDDTSLEFAGDPDAVPEVLHAALTP